MQSQIPLPIEKCFELSDVKIAQSRGFQVAHRLEDQGFGPFAQLSADGRNPFEQNFSAAGGQALRNRAGKEQSEKATQHHQQVEPGQRPMEPARRQAASDMKEKEDTSEHAGVDVKLQPAF